MDEDDMYRAPPRALELGAAPSVDQVFLAFGDTNSATSVTVSWVTAGAAPSTVKWGTKSGVYTATATGSSATYSQTTERTPAGYTSGQIHHVAVTGLQPNTQYFYLIAGSTESSFATMPVIGAASAISLAVVGDLGQTADSANTVMHMSMDRTQAILHVGDLSYADGLLSRWDSWGTMVQPVARLKQWMMCPGNHEIGGGENMVSYQKRFFMPSTASGSTGGNLYYSFDVASVHVIALSSYTDFSASSHQAAWLKADLAKLDRTVTPWLVVMLHAPWYNSNKVHQGGGEHMRVALEDTLFAAHADVVFTGHVHAYERSVPVYNNKPNAAGPVHITVGDGGNREGLASGWISPQPSWSAFRQAQYGHGVLDVVNATHARWEWHRDVDASPVVTDGEWFVRARAPATSASVLAPAAPFLRGGAEALATQQS